MTAYLARSACVLTLLLFHAVGCYVSPHGKPIDSGSSGDAPWDGSPSGLVETDIDSPSKTDFGLAGDSMFFASDGSVDVLISNGIIDGVLLPSVDSLSADVPADSPSHDLRSDSDPDVPVLQTDGGVPNGVMCINGTECLSGFCSGGLCCNKSCTGCFACAHASTGKPDGTCAPVTNGLSSKGACLSDAETNACGNDGTCDGLGACRKVTSGTACGVPSCSGTYFIPASTCDGLGACKSHASENCGDFQCNVSGCLRRCLINSDCSSTSFCNSVSGLCEKKVANGGSCNSGNASSCLSGNCVNGICCVSSVCSACHTCSSPTGTCSPSPGLNGTSCGTNLFCKDGSCSPCTPNQACNTGNPCEIGLSSCSTGSVVCEKAGNKPNGTVCGAIQTCSGSTMTPGSACNSTGSCIAGAPITCQFGCNGNACATKLTNGSSCLSSDQCSSGACAKDSNGAHCVSECGSAAGYPCCIDHPCAGFTSCNTSFICQHCGLAGEPCCDGSICSINGTVCDSSVNLCTACGTPGRLCCAGNTCSQGSCNPGGYCQN